MLNALNTIDFKLKIAGLLFGTQSEYNENRETKEKYSFTKANGEKFIITMRSRF